MKSKTWEQHKIELDAEDRKQWLTIFSVCGTIAVFIALGFWFF